MEITTDIDPTVDLIARVYQQAVKDAIKGDEEAVEFLNITAPDWRERLAHSCLPGRGQEVQKYGTKEQVNP
jgi:hypothetical protein